MIEDFDRRVELHLHTAASKNDSVTGVREYLAKAVADCQRAMAVTDFESTGAFFDAANNRPDGFQLLYGMEFSMLCGKRIYHVTALAKEEAGLKNLSALASKKQVSKSSLSSLRSGLLIGSACDEGELYQALFCNQEEAALKTLASFYDYIEVQPPANFEFLVERGIVPGKPALVECTKKLIALGASMNIPVVAVGDVCFSDLEDMPLREALLMGQGMNGAYAKAPLYFRTTGEMLNDFSFLDAVTARSIVVINPNKIARLCKKELIVG